MRYAQVFVFAFPQSYENTKPVLPGQYSVPVTGAGQPLTSYPHGHPTAAMMYGSSHQQHGTQVAVSMHSHQPMLHAPMDSPVTGGSLPNGRGSSNQASYPGKLQQTSKPYAFNSTPMY